MAFYIISNNTIFRVTQFPLMISSKLELEQLPEYVDPYCSLFSSGTNPASNNVVRHALRTTSFTSSLNSANLFATWKIYGKRVLFSWGGKVVLQWNTTLQPQSEAWWFKSRMAFSHALEFNFVTRLLVKFG